MGYFIRRFLVILLVLVVILIALLPLWTSKMAEEAFQNSDQPWADDAVRRAAQIKFFIFMYDDALDFCVRGVETFPNSCHRPFFAYTAGLASEKEKTPEQAIKWFAYFVKEFPRHPWASQAKGHLRKLEAMNQTASEK